MIVCKNSFPGMVRKSYGSRSSWLFLSGLLFFLASSLFADPLTIQVQQTPPSDQYSKMTRDELMKQIEQKDALMREVLVWKQEEKISREESERASEEQLASRDKLIRDQALALKAVTQERDEAKAELGRQQVTGWLEKALWGLGGLGLGYVAGDLTPKR